MNLFWHRRDLRLQDNAGLAAAAAADTTLPVFVVDTDLLATVGTRQRAFWVAGLRRLREAYRDRGSDLVVREGPPADVLADVAERYGVERVYYNDHYRPARHDRQRQVDAALPTESVTDLVLVDPARLEAAYPSHSQFYTDWQAVEKPAPYDSPASSALADVTDDAAIPAIEADIDLLEAGYDAARRRFDRFLESGIETYNDTRDDMAAAVDRPVSAVSRLSPYLAAGMIGIREVWADATDRYAAASDDHARKNIDKFRYELSWREQNYHLLYYNPNLPTENYKQIPNPIAWRNDTEEFTAWTRGE
ncbi:MAG: deoxyribodipyrimidine photo-lyase, partial [Natrialbaceae archaeon]